jgi:hypothetical protein
MFYVNVKLGHSQKRDEHRIRMFQNRMLKEYLDLRGRKMRVEKPA